MNTNSFTWKMQTEKQFRQRRKVVDAEPSCFQFDSSDRGSKSFLYPGATQAGGYPKSSPPPYEYLTNSSYGISETKPKEIAYCHQQTERTNVSSLHSNEVVISDQSSQESNSLTTDSSLSSSTSEHVTVSSGKVSSLDSYFTVPNLNRFINEEFPSVKTTNSNISSICSSHSTQTSSVHSNSRFTRLIPSICCGFGIFVALIFFLYIKANEHVPPDFNKPDVGSCELNPIRPNYIKMDFIQRYYAEIDLIPEEIRKKFRKLQDFERDAWAFVPLILSRHLAVVNSDQVEIQKIMNGYIGTTGSKEVSVAELVAMAQRYKSSRYYAHAIAAYYFASQLQLLDLDPWMRVRGILDNIRHIQIVVAEIAMEKDDLKQTKGSQNQEENALLQDVVLLLRKMYRDSRRMRLLDLKEKSILDAMSLYHIAKCFGSFSDHEEEIRILEEGIELITSNVDDYKYVDAYRLCLTALGDVYAELGYFARAEVKYKRVLDSWESCEHCNKARKKEEIVQIREKIENLSREGVH